MLKHLLKSYLSMILLTFMIFLQAKAQTPIAICPQQTTFSSMVRGYHFTAPCDFTICGVYIPTDASTGLQSVSVVRFTAGPPPAYAGTTNNFVQLLYQPNWPTNTMIPCNINVTAGQIIGVYGARSSSMINSYGQAQCMTTILGNSVMLERSGMQANLSTQPMQNIWSEVWYYVGRIIMYINCCPTATFTAATPICLGSPSTVNYTGSGTAGVANFSWNFQNGTPATANTIGPHSVSWSNAGTYNIDLSVTQSGCTTATSTQQVVVNPLPTANAGPDVAICQGQSTLLSGSGGNSFSWSNGITTPTTSVTPITTTTYTLTVTGAGGCTGTDAVVVTVNNSPVASAGPDVAICQGNSTTLTATGGGTYLWSNQSTASTITVSPSVNTTYTVTVSSAAGCTATDAVVVTVNPLPTANAGPDVAICSGQTTALNASGGSSYLWSTTATSASINVSPTSTATYTVTVYSSAGCSAQDNVIVSVNPQPPANAGPDQSICTGNSVVLNASGGLGYLWSTNPPQTTAQITVTPMQTITYTVTVVDINGCTASDDIVITVYTTPPVSAGNDTSTCLGTAVLLTGTGGGSYLWSTSETTSAISVLPSITTTYTVTITDVNGCSATDDVIVSVNPIPLLSLSPTSGQICLGDSIMITASGAINYSWSPSAGLAYPSAVSTQASPAATTTYIVTGTNQFGCSGSASATITVEPYPVISINPGNPTICQGQAVSLTAGGAATYSWSPALGLSSTNGAVVSASPAATTSYFISGTSSGGCVSSAGITVNVLPVPQVSFTADIYSGCEPLIVNFEDVSQGNIQSWLWNFDDPSSGNSNVSTLPNPNHTFSAGIYSITLNIITNDGCSGSMTMPGMINVYPNPVASFIMNPNIGNMNQPTISFIDQSINASSWQWNFGDPASASNNFSSSQFPFHTYSAPGDYIVWLNVVSSNGCIDSASNNMKIQDSYTFWAPNAFSPNGDGINEYFIPKGSGIDPDKFRMHIFDRWGKEIYYTDSFNNPWDGTVNNSGVIAPQGVYVWVVYATERTGLEHKYIGRITLIP